jgi:hypothetical protein
LTPRTTGSYAPRILRSTDGCGNDIRFRITLAYLSYNGAGTNLLTSTNLASPYSQKTDIQKMLDFFGDISNHGQGIPNGGKLGVDGDWYDSLTGTENNFNTNMGFKPATVCQADGDINYLYAAQIMDEIYMMTDNLVKYDPFNAADNAADIDKLCINRRSIVSMISFTGNTTDVQTSLIAAHNACVADPSKRYWLISGGHNWSASANMHNDAVGFLNYIHDHYGAGGDDSIWFAGMSEIYEYLFLRKLIKNNIVKTISGNTIMFEFEIPDPYNVSWKELSFLISGIANMNDVITFSVDGPAYGVSKAINDSSLLVNIDYNKNSKALAEKYLALAIASPTSERVADAYYFINRLNPNINSVLRSKLSTYAIAPTLNSIVINNNDTSTANRLVTISLSYTGYMSEYMVSETSTFSGATWNVLTTTSFPYTFATSIIETKTIYVKIRNAYGVSATMVDSISYLGLVLSFNSVIINSGAGTTQTAEVVVSTTYSNSTPTYYRIGETPDLSTNLWITWTGSQISYNLTALGTRTVYVQLQDNITTTNTLSDSILYSPIDLKSVIINSGSTSTPDQIVHIAFNYLGYPTDYMLSENADFSGATWTQWIGGSGSTVTFTLSLNNGVKTVYGKMRDINSYESVVVNDTISLAIASAKRMKASLTTYSGTSPFVSLVSNGETWNQGKPSVTSKALKDTNGNAYCSVIASYTGIISASLPIPMTGTVYDAVLSGGLVWYTGSPVVYTIPFIITFTGLVVGKIIRVKVFGTDNRSTEQHGAVTISGIGSETQAINPKYNVSNINIFENVVVPSNGSITLSLVGVTPDTKTCIQIVEFEEVG